MDLDGSFVDAPKMLVPENEVVMAEASNMAPKKGPAKASPPNRAARRASAKLNQKGKSSGSKKPSGPKKTPHPAAMRKWKESREERRNKKMAMRMDTKVPPNTQQPETATGVLHTDIVGLSFADGCLLERDVADFVATLHTIRQLGIQQSKRSPKNVDANVRWVLNSMIRHALSPYEVPLDIPSSLRSNKICTTGMLLPSATRSSASDCGSSQTRARRWPTEDHNQTLRWRTPSMLLVTVSRPRFWSQGILLLWIWYVSCC